MDAHKDMRILIAGGSVAGLSLAIMLERFGIDYLVLEAYSEIAPQLGASIGMLPNGLQILDQLGCYDRLREIGGDVYYKSSTMASDGRILSETKGASLSERMEDETGYPCVFIDRQMLLQVLYDKIQHKERVLTGKRVIHVEFGGAGVIIKTEDGSTYSGDILVGADGVRSTVRQEMWRLAADQNPGTFPSNEAESLNSNTKCIFGISKQPQGWRGMQHSVFYKGRSYLLVPGPEGRVYWFFFHVMDRDYYGRETPRFSKDDEAELASKHLDDAISDTITFGDIYKGRRFSTLVALEEHVFSRWHYRRIVLIGDSAHKLHPITAQGGNGALETAAVLTNALVAKLRSSQHKLSDEEIESVLGEVQAARIDNVTAAMKEGRWSNAIVCQQLPLAGLLIRIVIPWFGDSLMYNSWIKAFRKGTRVNGLEMPQRVVGKLSNGKANGKADSQRQARGWTMWVTGVACSGLAAFMIMRLRKI